MNTSTSVRVRFAPSPTGHLHVGGARTALFNYLFARHEQGRFFVRIEDTDKERSDPRFIESILDSLKWLGLSWDESPLYQSRRQQRHIDICRQLLKSGHAYRCFCTPEISESRRSAIQSKNKDAKYLHKCIHLTKEQIREYCQNKIPFTVRFLVPEGETTFDDIIHGSITVQNQEIDDFIIQRSDKSPVYQIAVVSDDHDMGITHVLRGDDHLSNTPKQILLYQALNWRLPEFGHLPLILGPDKKRLSKRHGATSVEMYRNQGILPITLNNFLALLGWSPGNDLETMDMNTMIHLFTLDRISRKPAVFDLQKLEWMNSAYIAQADNAYLLEYLRPEILKLGWLDQSEYGSKTDYLNQILDLLKPRMKTIYDFIDQAPYFFKDPDTYDNKAVQKHWISQENDERMKWIHRQLKHCKTWNESSLELLIRNAAENIGVGAGKLIHPLRLAVTGRGVSPGLFEVMAVLGRERVMARLNNAIKYISDMKL